MISRERARALRALIVKAAASLDDSDALDALELYDPWEPGAAYTAGRRLRYGGALWRVRQAHSAQAQFPPGLSTAALYERIARPGQGDTAGDPIPYAGGMQLFSGKYYAEAGAVYRCFRDTGAPVYNSLSELLGLYVALCG